MKSASTSFLFFYAVVIGIFCTNDSLHSQSVADSTAYYYDLAMTPKTTNDFLLAYDFFSRQKELCLKNNNINGVIYNLGFIAIIQNESGFYYDSETSSIEGLSLLDTLDENPFVNDSKVTFYNQLGKVNRALNNFDLALLYYDKALELTENAKHINKIINNRAFVYIDSHQYDKALVEIERAYKLSLTEGDDFDIARNLDNLGYVKSKLNHKDALALMDSALSKRLKLKDHQGTFASYNHLSEYYKSIGDTQMAESSIKKALLIAEKINSDSYKLEALSQLMLFNEDENVKNFKALNDKINLERLKKESKYASRKYQYQKQEARARANELKFEKEKSKTVIAVSTTLFIILLALFLFYLLRSKHKKEKLQQVYTTETRISKKVHDEVANDIYHVMTKLQNSNTTNDDVLDDLDQIYTRTRDISKENSAIELNLNFGELINDLLLSYSTKDVNVITKNNSKINWEVLSDIKKTTLYRVLQELMTNMRKHSKASVVVLTFSQSHKTITINYKDNGVGAALIQRSGLQNAENRINAIHGTLTFESERNKGFTAQIRI
jgi:signal transduction histidine kinase